MDNAQPGVGTVLDLARAPAQRALLGREPGSERDFLSGELRGRGALVTGSTSGIGLAIAQALAAQGADVMLNGFGEPTYIEDLCAALADAYHVKVAFSGADISQSEQIRDMVRYAAHEFGALDILVNNAGIQHVAPIEDFADERWDKVLATNLSSSFHAIKAALPAMRARRWAASSTSPRCMG
jgi:3-hydroxybutyrate dehydrogenase